MRNLTGYFLWGSKSGGRMRKPWTWTLPMEGNQKDSIFGRSSWSRRGVLRWVRAVCFRAVSRLGGKL
jgi:hypothetical protein